MKIQRIEEFQIGNALRQSIRQILEDCFQVYPDNRIYFKQLPDFRFLAWENDTLAGHMAVEHRVVNNGGEVVRIFGVVDLCVNQSFQHQKLATRLLLELESLGKHHEVDFLMLVARDLSLYQANGFSLQQNLCQWLVIQSHQTIGVVRRVISHALMVKPLGDKKWNEGPVDFLGSIF